MASLHHTTFSSVVYRLCYSSHSSLIDIGLHSSYKHTPPPKGSHTGLPTTYYLLLWRGAPVGERTYVSRYLCSPVPMFPEPMFPGTYVPRYLCSPVPMFPGFCTLIVVISINRLQILHTPWYDSRLWLCLGFRFRVLVRVRVRVRLELQTFFRLWLGCGLGLSLHG